MHKLIYISVVLTLSIFYSCLDRQFIEGRVEFIGSIDTNLNDSSLIFGKIFHVDQINGWQYYENQFEVWLENTELIVTSDTNGFYSLKTLPGTYKIKCQSTSNRWEKLVEELSNVELIGNKKTQINFYIGYTIE